MSSQADASSRILLPCLAGMGAAFVALLLAPGAGGTILWLATIAAWLLFWLANQRWSAVPERSTTLLGRAAGIGIPVCSASRCCSCGR